MSSNPPDALYRAGIYLEAGQPEMARPLLIEYIQRHPDSEEAWLLMSQAVEDVKQQADCLRQALKINPSNIQTRQQLSALNGKPPAPPRPVTAAPAPARPVQAAQPTPPPAPPAAAPTPDSIDFWLDGGAGTAGVPQPAAASRSVQPPISAASATPATPLAAPKPALAASAVPPISKPEPLLPSFAPDAPSKSAPTLLPGGIPSPLEPGDENAPIIEQTLPEPAAGHVPDRKAAQSKKRSFLPFVAIGVALVLLVIALGAGYWLWTNISTSSSSGPLGTPLSAEQAAALTLQSSLPNAGATKPPLGGSYQLPPTWTPTLSPTPTSTRTPTSTPQPSPSPTLMGPLPTNQALMDRIQQEVSDLRGLPILADIQRYVTPPLIIEKMLRDELSADGTLAGLSDETRSLSVMGLIKPTYDMVRYALNSIVDNIGGFYRNDNKTIYVLSFNFRGAEHFVYAHEYDHALVDQHFNLSELRSPSRCDNNDDRCRAITALIEGDATLAMQQWLIQYASPQDIRDLLRYRAPAQALPEQYPPDYVVQMLYFPYDYGLIFVERLYKQGNWARVNQAYSRLPESSEQIIHTDKYALSEAPIPVEDFPLSLMLLDPWRSIDDNVMGEWTTFLILGYGADKLAQQPVATAKKAAAGWGGDHYQVYYNDQTDQTVLAAHWVWDSTKDAQEFKAAISKYLEQRFRGAALPRGDGACWEVNMQATCLFTAKTETLWVMAPDQGILDQVLTLYPDIVTK